ncbi:DUF1643 domain-containing protein [Paenibacillus sp. MBLB4367]|uniref:DUF1643 domain-containing protein n=1 Tax=Paenibacillus sp. MBLB4367 TaxID=3384767 RepID=UPI00390823D2
MSKFNEFKCYGHFYKITKDNMVVARCRSQLDIINADKMKFDHLIDSVPDALSIMMNPGTSRPADSNYIEKEIDLDNFITEEKEIVHTIPDDTQKRLMRVMQIKKWKHLRVINLSDIRQPESQKLSEELKQYNKHSLLMEHSIFSGVRKNEVDSLLKKMKGKPIIIAWGTQNCLNQFAKVCLTVIKGHMSYGVTAKKNYHFQHPLTTKLSWVDNILKLMT